MTTDTKRLELLSKINPRSLELILYPTEQCNFRCTYCYEDFEIGKMTSQVQAGVKRLIERRMESLDHLHLAWFGGEPLVARDVLLDLSAFAKRTCESAGVGLTGSITTNGYHLTPEVAEMLCAHEQRNFQISLDGYEEGHDETRILASGSGTFQRIWGNLLALSQTSIDFKILLRLHLTPSNTDSIRRLASEILKYFGDDHRFSVFLKPIENLGGANSENIHTLSGDGKRAVVSEIRALLSTKENQEAKSLNICYASRPNSLAIRANGLIQKCTVMLSSAGNTVGRLGDDGTLQLDREKMQGWMRGFLDGSDSALSCPAHGFPDTSKKVIPILQK